MRKLPTAPQDIVLWFTAQVEGALNLQRPLINGALGIIARGGKVDEGGLAV
jgi:hypothetical protein